MLDMITGLLDPSAPAKMKIAIIGEQKTGKSWFAMSAPGPVFVADFDGRSESVKEYIRKSGRTDIYAKSYQEKDARYPNAILDFEQDIDALVYAHKNGKEVPVTYILDSITFMRSACERELIRQQPKMSRQIKLGGTAVSIPEGWDVVNGVRSYLENIIGRLSPLGNVIAIFHELDEKDTAASTKTEKRYTGKKTVQPQYLATLLSTFNDVYRIKVEYGGQRVAVIKPVADFLGATSMSTLDNEEVPDIQAMLAKHKKLTGA